MKLMKLTDWEDGSPVYVHPNAIQSIRRLPASKAEPSLRLKAIAARTRVDTDKDSFLVRETPDEIVLLPRVRPCCDDPTCRACGGTGIIEEAVPAKDSMHPEGL